MTSYKWRNDAEIWKYTGHRPDRIITPEIELAWIDKVLADKSSRRFAICLRENNRYIGNVQLTDIKDDCAAFHIFIGAKEFWGQGAATAATEQLIEFAANELNLKMLKLWVNPLNIAAQKVYQKCGFLATDDKINMILRLK